MANEDVEIDQTPVYIFALNADVEDGEGEAGPSLRIVVDAPNGNVTPIFISKGDSVTIHERRTRSRIRVIWEE